MVHLHRTEHDVVHIGNDLDEYPVAEIEQVVEQTAQRFVLPGLYRHDHLLDVLLIDNFGNISKITQARKAIGQYGMVFAPAVHVSDKFVAQAFAAGRDLPVKFVGPFVSADE